MKKIVFTSFIALLALASSIYADGDYENPELSAYMAEKGELPPPPKLEFPFPEGVYVGATIGGGKNNPIRIVDQLGTQLTILPPPNKKNSVKRGGVSIGYLFSEAGWFNQLDIQYITRNAINYSAAKQNNCILPGLGCTLNTSVKTQTGMARLYSTLNIGYSLFPYIFGGVGIYHNKAPATLTLTNGQVIQLTNSTTLPQTIINNTSTTTNTNTFVNDFGQMVTVNNVSNTFTTGTKRTKPSRTGAAGSIGAGIRFRVSPHIMLDINYEYAYLGKVLNWNVLQPGSTNFISSFKGDKLNGQSINASILFQPWGFASEGD